MCQNSLHIHLVNSLFPSTNKRTEFFLNKALVLSLKLINTLAEILIFSSFSSYYTYYSPTFYTIHLNTYYIPLYGLWTEERCYQIQAKSPKVVSGRLQAFINCFVKNMSLLSEFPNTLPVTKASYFLKVLQLVHLLGMAKTPVAVLWN